MKIIFIIVLLLHGLIHIIGFAKAFAIYNAPQFTQTISKPIGLLWLLAFVLFFSAAFLLLSKNSYWWLFGFIAILVSQMLIMYTWQDAKFGTIANVIILIASVIGYGTWSFNNQYKTDVESHLHQYNKLDNSLLTETDIQRLPEPVQKYIRYSGSIGKPRVKNIKIEFTGKIRKDEQSAWMPFTSVQYNFFENPTRLFFMNAEMKKLPIAGYHFYRNGIAFMDIRLFSLFRVQYQDGKEMNEAETVTFFNDMCCMAPATLIDSRISWQVIGKNHVKAIFSNKGIRITAELFFNEEGALINFKSNDRYNADAGKKLPWATPLSSYKSVGGYMLPGYAETIYTYPNKDLCYGTFEVTSIQYNCNASK